MVNCACMRKNVLIMNMLLLVIHNFLLRWSDTEFKKKTISNLVVREWKNTCTCDHSWSLSHGFEYALFPEKVPPCTDPVLHMGPNRSQRFQHTVCPKCGWALTKTRWKGKPWVYSVGWPVALLLDCIHTHFLHSYSSVAACILAGARRIPFDVHSPCLLSRWPCFSTN
jgi:hypothetical protein